MPRRTLLITAAVLGLLASSWSSSFMASKRPGSSAGGEARAGAIGLRSGGIFGYSSNPAHGGAICTACHSGGQQPTVVLSGPSLVQVDKTASYELRIIGGQKHKGGLCVSVTDGLFTAIGNTRTDGDRDEITHIAPKNAESNGDVLFQFDWTAPSTPTSATIYGAGNSVNGNGSTFGDHANADQLAITVDACVVDLVPFGQGTAGLGGFVPKLDGVPGPCSGGGTLDLTDARGKAFTIVLVSDQQGSFDYAGGTIYVDFASPAFFSLNLRLLGAKGAPGAGFRSLTLPDLSFAAGTNLYLQALVADIDATKGVALSNGLEMRIGT